MNSSSFENAPQLGNEFKNAPSDFTEQQIETEQSEPQKEPDEFNYDPPRTVFDSERVMAPTPSPSGTLSQDVQQELDPAAQRAMHDAQQHAREIDDDFTDLRSIDEVPGAAEEYEAYISEQDDFEQRMTDRFNHAKENELER